jgi:hypothetical protein
MFDKNEVRSLAEGRWDAVFSALAPQLQNAMDHAGHHVACPVHGGTDGFRLFPNYREKGAGVCNTCGLFNSGFDLLQWCNHWTFSETVQHVGEALGLKASSKIVSSETEGTVTEGKVRFIGLSKGRYGEQFAVVMEDRQGEKRFWGKDLERAVRSAGISVGDNARITLVCTQTCESAKGQTFRRHVWAALRLESDEEAKARLEKEALAGKRKLDALRQVWRSSRALQWDSTETNPVLTYLRSRGIELNGDESDVWTKELRYSAALEFVSDEMRTKFPAMVALVRDPEGKVAALHRTYLTPEGRKAAVECPKKVLNLPNAHGLNGCAVRLGGAVGGILCLAEGIETALSVCLGTGYPCWSTISANGLKTVEVPDSVKTVFIFEDKDRSGVGHQAAVELQERLLKEGRLAVIVAIEKEIPEGSKGLDWNDLLMAGDRFPFRKPQP